jgi:hypothetical protein
MADNVNRADVLVNLRDVFGETITDEVEITFFNQKVQSLNQKFPVQFNGARVRLQGVPAFPLGLAQVFIKPKRYRSKSIFVNVMPGEENSINEDFFVDPDFAQPRSMEFQDLAAKTYGGRLLQILQDSGIGEAQWNAIDPRNRATILNLSAKMLKETTSAGRSLITLVNTINESLLTDRLRARIYSDVDDNLLNELKNFPEKFRSVSGVLHDFPDGATPVTGPNSFKSNDAAGNIQFTFARKVEAGFEADIDLDDHSGVQHAADVLKHKIRQKDTDPYDIHEILIFFQHLDPEYSLL